MEAVESLRHPVTKTLVQIEKAFDKVRRSDRFDLGDYYHDDLQQVLDLLNGILEAMAE